MSVSLYYTAKRDTPITDEENALWEAVVKRYEGEYPFGEMYEGFCVYEPDASDREEHIIFSGATKLPPSEDGQLTFDVCNYWLKCLDEIIDALPGAKWHVNMDDVDLRLDE